MKLKECAKLLRRYSKWRKGKGRKYASPEIPFSLPDIDSAIDIAVKVLSAVPNADDIVPARTASISRIKKFTGIIRDEQAQ